MDIAFAEKFTANHLNLTYITPEQLEANKRLIKLVRLILDEGVYNQSTDIQIIKMSETQGIVRLRIGSEIRAHRLIHGAACEPLAMVLSD